MVECLRTLEAELGPEKVSSMARLYTHQLWHELTDALFQLEGPVLIPVFRDFLKTFQDKVNPIRLAELAIRVTLFLTPGDAITFLESVKVQEPQAVLFLTIARGAKLVELGRLYEGQGVLEESQKQVEVMSDLENSLYSGLYEALAKVHKLKGNLELFYRYSLQYLAYTPPDQVMQPHQLAVDLAISVLLADTLYNLGELIEQPVFISLKNTPESVLYDLILMCYEGRVEAFEHALQDPNLPDELRKGQSILLQKVKILAVMELAFHRERGQLTFKEIAEVGNIPLEQVEWLLMKAMSKDLLRGQIDQVQQIVVFNYVQPRVLDTRRLEQIRARVHVWKETVQTVLRHLEQNSKELID